MAARKFVTFSLGCLLLIIGGSLAQPNPEGDSNGVQEGVKGNPPQFIQDLDDGDRTIYFSIKFNNSLTKGQIVSAIQDWLKTMPQNVQTDYANWQANITQMKDDFVNKLKANLSTDGSELFDRIQSIVEDQSINYTETCQQILSAVNGSSQAAQEDLESAVVKSFSGHIASQYGPNGQNGNMGAGESVGASANGQPPMGMKNGQGRPAVNPCQQFMGNLGPHGGFTSSGMGAAPGSQMMPLQAQGGGQNDQNNQSPAQNNQNGHNGPMPLQNGQMPGQSQSDQKTKRGSDSQSVQVPLGQNSQNGQNGLPPIGQPGQMGQNGQPGQNGQMGPLGSQMGSGMMNGQIPGQSQHNQRRKRSSEDYSGQVPTNGQNGPSGFPPMGQNGQPGQNGQMGTLGSQMGQVGGQVRQMGSGMVNGQVPGQPQNNQGRRRRNSDGQNGQNGAPPMGQSGQVSQQNRQSGQNRLPPPGQSGQSGQIPPMPGQSQANQRRRRQIQGQNGQMTGQNGQSGFPPMGQNPQIGSLGSQPGQMGTQLGQMGTGMMNGQQQQLPNGGLPMQVMPLPNDANNSNPGMNTGR